LRFTAFQVSIATSHAQQQYKQTTTMPRRSAEALSKSEAELVSANRLTTLAEAGGRKKVGVIGTVGTLALYSALAFFGSAASVPPVVFSLFLSATLGVYGTGFFSV
jgi:hypothetical protein